MSFALFSGTISFKDGTTITDAEIISIKDGLIKIKKDNKERTFSLDKVASFSGTDISSGGGGGIPGEFTDYKITIDDIKMPDKGEDKDGKTEQCEVSYTLTRKNPKIDKMKVPFFYLYVLAAPSSGDEERKQLLYYHPKEAKVKEKGGYDETAILEKVRGFDRRIVDYEEALEMTLTKRRNLGARKINFELKKVDTRKIIAYHLEVWGNDSKIVEKNWKDIDYKIADRWWER
jgi:hypothetical protein